MPASMPASVSASVSVSVSSEVVGEDESWERMWQQEGILLGQIKWVGERLAKYVGGWKVSKAHREMETETGRIPMMSGQILSQIRSPAGVGEGSTDDRVGAGALPLAPVLVPPVTRSSSTSQRRAVRLILGILSPQTNYVYNDTATSAATNYTASPLASLLPPLLASPAASASASSQHSSLLALYSSLLVRRANTNWCSGTNALYE